ncbi:MAG: 1-deoxy-D-xylulose-5-phosphate synthase, partial [Betaproteobacteria bacterium]
HDLDVLCSTLKNLRQLDGPQFLHVVTRKGKGYEPAEDDAILYHGVGKFDPPSGITKSGSTQKTFTQVFGDWICDEARTDDLLVGITPAMREGSGLVRFSQEYPDRYFDVGIAEQHAVTFAGGLAVSGYKPVVAIYSTFLQRAYDQLIHDICLQNLDVTFAVDRGGIVGADGPTHHGAFDLAFLRCIPNIVIMTPSDENECRQMLHTAYRHPGPAVVRYPRGSGSGVVAETQLSALEIGKAEIVLKGDRGIAILVFGTMLDVAKKVAARLSATLVNMRYVKPIDENLILELAKSNEWFVTLEDGVIAGGGGSAVAQVVAQRSTKVLSLGYPDQFITHGDPGKLVEETGLDEVGILKSISNWISD